MSRRAAKASAGASSGGGGGGGGGASPGNPDAPGSGGQDTEDGGRDREVLVLPLDTRYAIAIGCIVGPIIGE